MKNEIDMKMIYQDHLVSITENTIIFEHYYFPTGKQKVVRFSDIERIEVKKSTILNGRWRIHGTGNFKIWFPRDTKRPQRDRIFFAKLRGQRIEIGFTVENAGKVESIFKERNLIKPE